MVKGQITISITVIGEVQGVFFRKHTRDKALELGLAGFVRNLEDGSVYIEASGEPVHLDQLVKWCHEGSPRARVTKVETQPLPDKKFDGFTIDRG